MTDEIDKLRQQGMSLEEAEKTVRDQATPPNVKGEEPPKALQPKDSGDSKPASS